MFLAHLCKENYILLPPEILYYLASLPHKGCVIFFTFINLLFGFACVFLLEFGHAIKQTPNTDYVLGTISGAENTLVNGTDKIPALTEPPSYNVRSMKKGTLFIHYYIHRAFLTVLGS